MAVACTMLALQLAGAGSATAANYSETLASKACSDIGISITATGGSYTTMLRSEITYHGNDCGDQLAATSISAVLWACDGSGANCFGVGNPDFSSDVRSYDFWDYRYTSTAYTGFYYKLCVSLRNSGLERYNVCTDLVSV